MPTAIDEQTELTALERIFRDNHGKIFATAYRITGNAADAEDVMQGVFLHLLRRPADAPPLEKLDGYLRRSAVNGALDILRSRRSVGLEDLPPNALRDPHPDPATTLEAAEIRAALRGAVAGLSPRSAEVFALRYFEGYRNLEIARMLGISQTLVAFLLYRTRSRLEKQLRSSLGGSP